MGKAKCHQNTNRKPYFEIDPLQRQETLTKTEFNGRLNLQRKTTHYKCQKEPN